MLPDGINETSLLERTCEQGHASASSSKHLREELLRQLQVIGLSQIAHTQKPPAHTRFDRCNRLAAALEREALVHV
jgi:hypothetical protein